MRGAVVFFVMLLASASVLTAAEKPIPIILDTDIGTDVAAR